MKLTVRPNADHDLHERVRHGESVNTAVILTALRTSYSYASDHAERESQQ